MNNKEIEKALKLSCELAVAAGEILKRYEKNIKKLQVVHKQAQGVASDADLASEKFILAELKKKFPDHTYLAEESFFKNPFDAKRLTRDGYSWMIDPLDGTNNFLCGLNYYGVCICLAYKGKPIMGVVYRPSTGECFFAQKGEGAWKKTWNGQKWSRKKPLNVLKSNKALSDSIVSTGFRTEKGKKTAKEFSAFQNILEQTRAVRRLGSAALDMCLVAEGIFDGFWEVGLAPWDVAASGLICDEAGAKMSDFNGKPFDPFAQEIIVSRHSIHSKLKRILNKVF